MSLPTLCPRCANPVDANGACASCPSPTGELVAKAEALYVSYLAARIVHARQRLKAAQRELLNEPRNRVRMDAVKRIEEEVLRLQNQLVAQTRESQRAQRAVEQSRFLGGDAASKPSPSAERKCPRCGGSMPGAVAHCRCGYVVDTPLDGRPALFSKEPDTITGKPGKSK